MHCTDGRREECTSTLDVSFGCGLGERDPIHGVDGLRVVLPKMHDLTFRDIKLHAPELRPLHQVIQALLEGVDVLLVADLVAGLRIFGKFVENCNQ